MIASGVLIIDAWINDWHISTPFVLSLSKVDLQQRSGFLWFDKLTMNGCRDVSYFYVPQ